MSFLPIALQAVLVWVAIVAAVYDFRHRRIPNWLVLAGLILGLSLNGFLFEWAGVKTSLLGMGLALVIYFPLYLLRGMGAGDVKLMAAIGSIVGPANWFGIFVLTALLGGVAAIGLLVMKQRLARGLQNVGFLVQQLASFKAPYAMREDLDVTSGKSLKLPHGVVIAFGCFVFLGSAWIWAPR